MYEYIIGGLLVILMLFTKSYFQEKGKLRALQQENSKIQDQNEKIKLEYSKELEELKKEHQLEISKRKYKYESKKDQYVNFFKLVDDFTRESNRKIQPKVKSIIENFTSEYLSAESHLEQAKAVTIMTAEMHKIISEANEDIIIIKQQTNSIKLIASPDVLNKISQLENAFEDSMNDSNKMISNLPHYMLDDNQTGMKDDQEQVLNSGLVTKKITAELINLMRKELDEI